VHEQRLRHRVPRAERDEDLDREWRGRIVVGEDPHARFGDAPDDPDTEVERDRPTLASVPRSASSRGSGFGA